MGTSVVVPLAVAGIAVVAALGGALVTAISQRKSLQLQLKAQSEHEIRQAAEQQRADYRKDEAERGKWLRELRLRTYRDCLDAFEKFRDVIADLAPLVLEDHFATLEQGEFRELDLAIARLRERYDSAYLCCQAVRLVGPVETTEAAHGLKQAVSAFLVTSTSYANAVKDGQHPDNDVSWYDATRRLDRALESFLEKASSIVER